MFCCAMANESERRPAQGALKTGLFAGRFRLTWERSDFGRGRRAGDDKVVGGRIRLDRDLEFFHRLKVRLELNAVRTERPSARRVVSGSTLTEPVLD